MSVLMSSGVTEPFINLNAYYAANQLRAHPDWYMSATPGRGRLEPGRAACLREARTLAPKAAEL
jgi:hypothetical protein